MKILGTLDKLAVAQKLPLGHYDREKAKEAVDEEYSLSRVYEKTIYSRLYKRKDLKPYYRRQSTAIEICNAICDFWKIPRIKTVILKSPDVKECAAGHYYRGEIHFKALGFGLIDLLHELSHHFAIKDKNYGGHGNIFISYEEMVADTFFNLF